MRVLSAVLLMAAVSAAAALASTTRDAQFTLREYRVPAGTHPHDVAPAIDGGVWYTAQHTGQLGWLDPENGRSRLIRIGAGSARTASSSVPTGRRGSRTAG